MFSSLKLSYSELLKVSNKFDNVHTNLNDNRKALTESTISLPTTPPATLDIPK